MTFRTTEGKTMRGATHPMNGFMRRGMFRGSRQQRSTLSNPAQWLIDWATGGTSDAGVTVNASTAMRVAVVFACCRVLAESLASLPLQMYRRTAGGKEPAPEHPLQEVLHDQPNPWQTSFEWREQMMLHLVLRGNAFSEIVPGPRGGVTYLVPLQPDCMRIDVAADNSLIYTYDDPLQNGRQRRIPREYVFHLRGLSSNGWVGLSPIQECKQALGLSIAAEKFGSTFFRNSARPSGIFTHPGRLRKDTAERLSAELQARFGGLDNAAKILVAEEGMTFAPVTITNDEAQFLETRKFQVEDICRIFRVPPHLVGHLERSTYSNIEHQSIEFVVHTIRPWAVRWEQAIRRDLIGEPDVYFAEFNLDGLLRGEADKRATANQLSLINGIKSVNEIRAQDNLNPLPGDVGDKHFVPVNLQTIEQAAEGGVAAMKLANKAEADQEGPAVPDPPDDDGNRSKAVVDAVVADIAERAAVKELRDVAPRAAHANEDRDEFTRWLTEWYAEKWAPYLRKALVPLRLPIDVANYAAAMGRGDLLQSADPAARLAQWEAQPDLRKELLVTLIREVLPK